MNPIEKYSELTGDILECEGTTLAFFRGSLEPRLLIVGEAPGPEENIQGRPFVGRSGQLLEYALEESGLSDVPLAYLNVVFRMPLNHVSKRFRQPSSEEIDFYRPMVSEIVTFLAPHYVLLCGNSACESLLRNRGITKLRGNWSGNVLPTYHPSHVLQNKEKQLVWLSDFKQLAVRLVGNSAAEQADRGEGDLEMDVMRRIKAISEAEGSAEFVGDLELISGYLESDPRVVLQKSRHLLEMLVSSYEPEGSKLDDRINALEGVPKLIKADMHNIRVKGNIAAHEPEDINAVSARKVFAELLSLFCWHFQIDDADLSKDEEPVIDPSTMKVRFFVADGIHKTWPKIAVLTEEGVLYSEYLAWMKPVIFRKEGFDFESFKSDDFAFGEEEHGNAYQALREVKYEEAANFQLNSQGNWVKSYIERWAASSE